MSTEDAHAPNRRQLPRIEVDSAIVYVALEKGLRTLGDGVGRAVNLSRNGLLLEVDRAIKAPYLMMTVAGDHGSDVPILGKVIHCTGNGAGIYQAGIKFLEDEEKKIVFSGCISDACGDQAQPPADNP